MTGPDRPLTNAQVQWDAVERALDRRRRRRAIAWVAAPALALAALVLVRARGTPMPAALALADGHALTAGVPLAAPATLHLSDRSRVTTTAGTSLAVARHGPTSVEFTLRAGHASFEVTPGGPRRWRVDCGLATVTVVGTGFDLDLDPARLLVTVRHGAVRVEGARVAQTLRAGASLTVWATPPVVPPTAVAPAVDVDAGVARAPRPNTLRRATPTTPRAPIDASVPDVPAPAVVDPVEALWARASEARRAQRYDEAVALFTTLVAEHPRSARAPMAAFLMGRDELRSLRRPRAAAVAYAQALSLGLAAGLREDAWLGLVESRLQSGDHDGARVAARFYAAEYPRGAYRAYIDSLVGVSR